MESRTIPPAQASARQTEMGDVFNRVLFAALDAMEEKRIPYALIGGIAASGLGRPRTTHDIDIFVRPEDADAALGALEKHGFESERTDPRWLFKGWKDEMMVDVIFKSHGDIYFDDEMHKRAKAIHYHGRDIPVVAPEDLVIIKAAVHSEIGPHHWHDALAILSHANVDWSYLLKRGRRAARRLLALLVYAQSNDIWIPNHIVQELFQTVFGHAPSSSGLVSHIETPRAPAPAKQSEPVQPAHHTAPKPQQPDAYIVGHLQDALAQDARTASLDAQLTVGGKKVLVKGEAASPELKMAIENVLRDHAPGFQIDNQIRVTEVSAPEVEEVV